MEHSLQSSSPVTNPLRRRPHQRRTQYRQVTLSECLNSSPSEPRLPSSPAQTHRPPLIPLLFNSRQTTTIPSRLQSTLPCDDHLHHQTTFSNPPSSPNDHHPWILPPPNTRRAIDQSFDDELCYKRPSYSDSSRKIKLIESLYSDPQTHTIKMWNSEYEDGCEFPFSLAFNHKARTGEVGAPAAEGELMAVGSALGTISLYRPSEVGPAEDRVPIKNLEGIQNGVFALGFSPSDAMLASGSGAQVSEIFDVESGNALGRLEAHRGTLKTLEFSPYNEQIIVTGSRDGAIKVWDLRSVGARHAADDMPIHPPVITIQHAHDEKYTGRKRKKGVHIPSVSAVLWSRLADHQIYSAGSANGVVKLWDIRKKSEFNAKKTHPTPADHSIDHQTETADLESTMGGEDEESEQVGYGWAGSQRPHGISSLVTSSDGARLYALGTDSKIRTHDGMFLSRPPTSHLRTFHHPSLLATSLYLKLALSPDDRFLGCTSSTGEIYVWDTAVPAPTSLGSQPAWPMDPIDEDDGVAQKAGALHAPVRLLAHRKEVCALQFWRQGLASCSDDASIRLWTYHHALLHPL